MPQDKLTFIQRLHDAFDDYYQSVIGLHAFTHSCTWDDKTKQVRSASHSCIPRRMDRTIGQETSEDSKAKTQHSDTVTPDGVVQASDAYGIVAEMKKNFNRKSEEETFEQLKKYDGDLVGWWTPNERIAGHDIALLTGLPTSTAATDAYARWREAGNSFQRPFAIVEFSLHTQAKVYMHLHRVAGQLSEPEHDERLRQSKQIDVLHLYQLFSRWKFMDNEPPILFMLVHVYEHTLPLFAAEGDFGREGATHPVVEVSAEEARNKMEEQFCRRDNDPRQFQLPRLAWVQKALDTLVEIGVASRVVKQKSKPKYRVEVRLRKKDTKEYFAERLFALAERKQKKHAAGEKQVDLFPNES